MTNLLKSVSVAFAVVVVSFALLSAPKAFAQSPDDFGDAGWDNYASSGWEDYASSGWDDSASTGWDDFASTGWDDAASTGWDDFASTGWDDFASTGWDDFASTGWDDLSSTGWDDFASTGYDDFSSYGYDEYGYDKYGYDTYGYDKGYGYASYGYSAPSYSQPIRVAAPVSAPQSVRSNPVFAPTPAPRPQPVVSTPVSNTTNTCVNNSCNTNINNIDNSINGSFNDNSINGSFNVTTLTQATPQRPIQYVFPQQNLSCVIVATPNSVQSGQTTTLSWSSYGASSAWLSDGLGTVPVNGSRVVNPISSRTYTLTISGLGGTQTCITYVTVGSMAPYVSLSQIPYTGFGGGPIENALYFGALLAFAASAAYLVLYFKGGAGSLLGGLFPAKAVIASSAFVAPAMFGTSNGSTPRVQKQVESETVIERLPSLNTGSAPKDSMSFAHGANGGIPRIVVTRS